MLRPRATLRRNGITSAGPSGPPKETRINASYAAVTTTSSRGRATPYARWVTVFSIWPDDVVWRRVSPRLYWLTIFLRAVWLVILGIAAAIGWYVFQEPLAPVIAGALAGLMLIRLVFVLRGIRSWGYAERADDLLVRHGLLIRRLSVVPYGRMQFVDVTAGPLERLFGLATVQLHTAAAASDARIPGLTPEEAARLRDRLAALGEARAAGL
ncbi:MAG: PH domain-containing protein [Micromonosporaceae bacterium]|nr:PH domain-containing protein [Micromonosporaceae bacterium]